MTPEEIQEHKAKIHAERIARGKRKYAEAQEFREEPESEGLLATEIEGLNNE